DYSTYLGGIYTDWSYGVAADSLGNAYFTGFTQSPQFPGASNSLVGTEEAFVTELNPSGTALVFSDYLGGNAYTTAWGITLDPSGNIYIAGETNSPDFPTTSNAAQASLNGSTNAFV